MIKVKRNWIVDGFSPNAKDLRREFMQRFENPRSANSGRFIWDYWHVPQQYTALRTPAYHFFPKTLYESFHRQLVMWGRKNLGCHDISPPWMSCYIDGCEQKLHGDLPHGPWAFVFSLTPWSTRKFTGGQTVLLKDQILDYWSQYDFKKGLEQEQIFELIEPKFNRLTVFDPRIPHGVQEVKGVQDVCQGRLVIHGWFVQPRPFLIGPLSISEFNRSWKSFENHGLAPLLNEVGALEGILSIRFHILPNGKVGALKCLAQSLRSRTPGGASIHEFINRILTEIRNLTFPKKTSGSVMTLPICFSSD